LIRVVSQSDGITLTCFDDGGGRDKGLADVFNFKIIPAVMVDQNLLAPTAE
jgi:hypothetical protein